MDNEPDWASPPGDTIESLIKEKNISIVDFAVKLKITLHELQLLLLGKKRIDRALAGKLALFLGNTENFWLKSDEQYVSTCKRLGKNDYK